MSAEVMVLRVIHLLGGIFWVGGMMFMTFFLMPVLAGLGPAAAPVMGGLNQKRFPIVMPIVALLTILSGLRLLMIMSASFGAGYFQSPVGKTLSMAGGLAIVAFVFGLAIVRPAMMKSVALGQQMAAASDDASRSRIAGEMASTRKRGAMGNVIVLVLLLLSALGMAVGRYTG
ncbi:MAG TPA: hypothetical protein VFO55_12235 [Gemmatimonadaceae bacterium]|nr:hypothetical protein [Gemmatimonadaceae bacterium]